MTGRRLIISMLIVLIVCGTAWWITAHWGFYLRILSVLWPIMVGFLVIMAILLEARWWLRFDPWYYQTGPTTCRERWQTCGADDEIRGAVQPVLNNDKWVGRESSEGFLIRRKSHWRHFGSRVFLALEDTDQGTAIRYEVRPLWTIPLLITIGPAFYFSRFRPLFVVSPFSWFLTPWVLLTVGFALAYYPWVARRAVRHMGRVKHIRRALARHGMRICETCGYDLFGHGEEHKCPECGTPFMD